MPELAKLGHKPISVWNAVLMPTKNLLCQITSSQSTSGMLECHVISVGKFVPPDKHTECISPGIINSSLCQPNKDCLKYWSVSVLSVEEEMQRRVNLQSKMICEGPSSFRCTDCTFQTAYKSSLVNHIEAKHFNYSYSCSLCGRVHSSKASLNMHFMRVHRDQSMKNQWTN